MDREIPVTVEYGRDDYPRKEAGRRSDQLYNGFVIGRGDETGS